MDEDPLAPARGILLAMALVTPFWLLVAGIVRRLLGV
jgi:hypothetical protein